MFKNFLKKVLLTLGYVCVKNSDANSKNNNKDINIYYKDEVLVRRLEQQCSNYEFLKVHLGCGPRVLKGWINIDLVFEPYEQYLKYYTDTHYPEEFRGSQDDFFAIDITQELPFDNNSVDLIFHEDFFEHISQKDQIVLLAESYRVLKESGVHRINTPDLIVSMRNHSDFSLGKKGVYENEWDKNGHINLLTPSYIEEIANTVGFSKVIFNGKNKSVSSHVPIDIGLIQTTALNQEIYLLI